jgi:hypothetical protein
MNRFSILGFGKVEKTKETNKNIRLRKRQELE